VAVGQVDPGTKSLHALFYFQIHFRKEPNLAKIIDYSLFVRKMQMTYQNV
jgi:hypothetical protein